MSDSMRDGAMVVHGQVEDPELGKLRKTIQDQRRQIAELENQVDDAVRDSMQAKRALASLRKSLSPLYRSLQAVFGDLDLAGIVDEPAQPITAGGPAGAGAVATGVDPRHAAVWASWKERLGAGPANVIDKLLIHGEMTATQLRIACACRLDTVYRNVSILKKAGLINKSGDKYSLKSL